MAFLYRTRSRAKQSGLERLRLWSLPAGTGNRLTATHLPAARITDMDRFQNVAAPPGYDILGSTDPTTFAHAFVLNGSMNTEFTLTAGGLSVLGHCRSNGDHHVICELKLDNSLITSTHTFKAVGSVAVAGCQNYYLFDFYGPAVYSASVDCNPSGVPSLLIVVIKLIELKGVKTIKSDKVGIRKDDYEDKSDEEKTTMSSISLLSFRSTRITYQ